MAGLMEYYKTKLAELQNELAAMAQKQKKLNELVEAFRHTRIKVQFYFKVNGFCLAKFIMSFPEPQLIDILMTRFIPSSPNNAKPYCVLCFYFRFNQFSSLIPSKR